VTAAHGGDHPRAEPRNSTRPAMPSGRCRPRSAVEVIASCSHHASSLTCGDSSVDGLRRRSRRPRGVQAALESPRPTRRAHPRRHDRRLPSRCHRRVPRRHLRPQPAKRQTPGCRRRCTPRVSKEQHVKGEMMDSVGAVGPAASSIVRRTSMPCRAVRSAGRGPSTPPGGAGGALGGGPRLRPRRGPGRLNKITRTW
jgi:hypothetical protein